jgi:dihydroorotase
VNLSDPWTVDRPSILAKCGWSPFEGVRFRSRVKHTFVNGHLVYEDGTVHDNACGQRLLFDPL